MTPEPFEAKWGEPLRAAGYTVNNLPNGNGLYINGKWFDGRCLVQEDSQAYARGLLVAWAVSRNAWVEPSKRSGRWWMWMSSYGVVGDDDLLTFDAALIAGCIALAKQGT